MQTFCGFGAREDTAKKKFNYTYWYFNMNRNCIWFRNFYRVGLWDRHLLLNSYWVRLGHGNRYMLSYSLNLVGMSMCVTGAVTAKPTVTTVSTAIAATTVATSIATVT